MRRRGFRSGVASSVVVLSIAAAAATEKPRLAPRLAEAPFASAMNEGFELAKAGKADEAFRIFDEIDRKFSAAYAGGPRVYCGHNARETTINMMRAAAESVDAIAIGAVWCDAIYFKAFALTDLGKPAEAAKELDRALKMAPEYPMYLNERAELLMRARRLDEARAMFGKAEANSQYMTADAAQLSSRSRSCRGVGFVLTKQGKLEDSEANYKRCLTIDPNDRKSKDELAYIAQQRAKKK